MWFETVIGFLFAQVTVTQALSLVAEVSSGGVKGSVTFTQVSPDDPVTVTFSLSGPKMAEAVAWQLHTFRVDYDVSDRCALTRLGPRIVNNVGGAVRNGKKSLSGFSLHGLHTIEGRSLVLLKAGGSPLSCATVESPNPYVTASATFRQGVLGHILFRQRASGSGHVTLLTSDLRYADRERRGGRVEWRVVRGEGCSTVGTTFNPTRVSGSCDVSNPSSCAIGDLGAKLGRVRVGDDVTEGRMTSVDGYLPLTGARSVVDRTVQLFVAGRSTPIACALIRRYRPRTGMAVFADKGFTVIITVSQRSPLDPTFTKIQVHNLRFRPLGYRLRHSPAPQRLDRHQDPCGRRSVGLTFNPWRVAGGVGYPGPGADTEDRYQVGDLSGKYGILTSVNTTVRTYRDLNLPLFGVRSALGRALTLHWGTDQSPPSLMCANLLDTAEVTSALATFTFPVIGQALLWQRTGEPESETRMYLHLDYADGSTDVTAGHTWALHHSSLNDDMLSSDVSTRCASAGDVVNPDNVSGRGYAARCRQSSPSGCKWGDLSGKHGPLSIRHQNGGRSVAYVIDVNLPLQGPNSVIGRSLVIYTPSGGSHRLSCADLLQLRPLQAQADRWGREEGGGDVGSVTFTQPLGVIRTLTTVQLSLYNLSTERPVNYQVHTGHLTNSQQPNCQQLGDVFNPLQVPNPNVKTLPSSLTLTSVRDLRDNSLRRTDLHPDLDLWGPWSVVGKTLTLTSPSSSSLSSSSSSSPLACASINPRLPRGARLLRAKAVFTGDVTGYVILGQVVYPGGAMTPTTVLIDLRKTSSEQTVNHEWHVHERAVGSDSTARSGRCTSTRGHYNPFTVDVQRNYQDCQPSNPLRCELGDLSGKQGAYHMASGPRMASDVFLPLDGPHGVVGRSVVIHGAERGKERIACANLVPHDMTYCLQFAVHTPKALDVAEMRSAVSRAVETAPYNVMVTQTDPRPSGCNRLLLCFLGREAERHLQTFKNSVAASSTDLETYRPVACTAAVWTSSLVATVTSSVTVLYFSYVIAGQA